MRCCPPATGESPGSREAGTRPCPLVRPVARPKNPLVPLLQSNALPSASAAMRRPVAAARRPRGRTGQPMTSRSCPRGHTIAAPLAARGRAGRRQHAPSSCHRGRDSRLVPTWALPRAQLSGVRAAPRGWSRLVRELASGTVPFGRLEAWRDRARVRRSDLLRSEAGWSRTRRQAVTPTWARPARPSCCCTRPPALGDFQRLVPTKAKARVHVGAAPRSGATPRAT